MIIKLAQTALKIAARNNTSKDPIERKAIKWLLLLMPLALIVTLAFAFWAPTGLVLPVYYIAALIMVIA